MAIFSRFFRRPQLSATLRNSKKTACSNLKNKELTKKKKTYHHSFQTQTDEPKDGRTERESNNGFDSTKKTIFCNLQKNKPSLK